MTELNKTEHLNQRRHDLKGSRSRRGLSIRLGLLTLLTIIALGNRGCEQPGLPTIICTEASVLVEPGTCTVFQNPCIPGQWLHPDQPEGFRFEPETDEQRLFIDTHELRVNTTRVGNETTRELCAGANVPLGQQSLSFVYGQSHGYGKGGLLVTVASALTLTATASPTAITNGESSQLLATVSGGIPPYFYEWTPPDSLNDEDIAAPVATPGFTTTYTVAVIDSGGQQKSTTVTVFVDFAVAVTASPDLINVGESSQLEAAAVGGVPPFTYSWTPTVGLNDPLRSDPLARPTTTTTYTARVTDSTGAIREGSATVRIRGALPLTADFVYNIQCCPRVDLDASASTGNIVSYTWDLSWTTLSPDRVTTSPFTSFNFNEIDRGTITLTVTGADGNTATRTRGFPSPGP